MPELKVLTHIGLQARKSHGAIPLYLNFTASARSRKGNEVAEQPLLKAGVVAEVADGRTLRLCGVSRYDFRANGHRTAAEPAG
ncbi:uncharacterized protein AFUA_5G07990 [Aspergillus fumigatus Af293]|jgi:hypothetical protein|uniref:Uncharacterized protein n=2 Tax=Aspergillus fumigatus TaxID=746128 RepID=Q4WUC7_ASPFU|nr:hypothetical protein AFUA_5G07990 [Aspergillus fumigatus Af293]EAL91799.1 hypothetical protein AFUA_5G07990 [Aspergillus fumigatus Af293]EDP51542.1 hypothetical protein AFUB_055520 [Aspergillus fumigatus A1163]